MGACRFYISQTNPNDGIGGGGCACSELANTDAAGPYLIFPGTEMANNLSPHTVVCLGCAENAIAHAHDDGALLSAGEADAPLLFESTADELDDEEELIL